MDKVGIIFRSTLANTIKEGVEKSKTTFVVSYSAVSASELDDLRKFLRKVGARVFVSKNRIAKIALKDIQQQDLGNRIAGQTAFIWSDADSVAISKTLMDFAKGRETFHVQGGLVEGNFLGTEQVKRLSELPPREVLLAQLLQTMLSPMTRLAGTLNAKTRDLLSIMKQLSEKKGGK